MPDFYPQSRISRNGSGNNSRGAYVGLHENSAEYVRLSGEPVTVPHLSGGEIAADVRTGTPQGTGGETVRHGHGMSGEPVRARLPNLSGTGAADRTRHRRTANGCACHRSEPVRRRDYPARSPQTGHRNATGRGGRSGRARTRPAQGNATAGGCRPVSGDCAREPVRHGRGRPSGRSGRHRRRDYPAHLSGRSDASRNAGTA